MDTQTFFYTYLDEYRFLAEFLIALLLEARLLPRKKATAQRLFFSIIAVALISHFTYPYNYGLTDDLEWVIVGIMFVRNIIVFLCVALCLFFSFNISFFTALSYTTSGYAIQHLTLNVYRVLDVLFIPKLKFEQLVPIYILVYASCYLLLYFLFVRNVMLSSTSVNGLNSGTRVVSIVPWWQKTLLIVNAVTIFGFAVCMVGTIVTGFQSGKGKKS